MKTDEELAGDTDFSVSKSEGSIFRPDTFWRRRMIIAPKSVYRVIRSTAPFVFISVLVQAILGILNKADYGGRAVYVLHGKYVPMVMLALAFLHAAFGFLSMFARGKYRESHAAQIVVVLAMTIVFILLVVLLAR